MSKCDGAQRLSKNNKNRREGRNRLALKLAAPPGIQPEATPAAASRLREGEKPFCHAPVLCDRGASSKVGGKEDFSDESMLFNCDASSKARCKGDSASCNSWSKIRL